MNERPVKCRTEARSDLPSRHAVLRRRIPRAAATSSSAITLASRASISRSVYRESSRTARTKPGGSASPVALSCSTLWRESLSLSSVRVGAASTCWAVGGGCGGASQPGGGTPGAICHLAPWGGQMRSGELTGGVPSVKPLSKEHGVSHIAAEKALDVLKREGLVRTAIGKGTYVIDRR